MKNNQLYWCPACWRGNVLYTTYRSKDRSQLESCMFQWFPPSPSSDQTIWTKLNIFIKTFLIQRFKTFQIIEYLLTSVATSVMSLNSLMKELRIFLSQFMLKLNFCRTIVHCLVLSSANEAIWSLHLSLAIRLAGENGDNWPEATWLLRELCASSKYCLSAAESAIILGVSQVGEKS